MEGELAAAGGQAAAGGAGANNLDEFWAHFVNGLDHVDDPADWGVQQDPPEVGDHDTNHLLWGPLVSSVVVH
jgi:hypothetical protein